MENKNIKLKKIKELELDLQVKLLEISNLNKLTKPQDRDIKFYGKISSLLEQAQDILSDKYYGKSKKTWPEKGLWSLLYDSQKGEDKIFSVGYIKNRKK